MEPAMGSGKPLLITSLISIQHSTLGKYRTDQTRTTSSMLILRWEITYWLEKEFDKNEFKKADFDLGYNKINGLDGI